MATDPTRVRAYMEKHPDAVMTSVYHHVTDVDNLRLCFEDFNAKKAVGIDGVTKEEYGRNPEAHLADLSKRLRDMGYRPQDRKRSYIPKPGSEKGRPPAISAFEDKIVEMAVKRVLEQIYEPLFLECSYGYREKRSPHHCIDATGRTIQQKRVNHEWRLQGHLSFYAITDNYESCDRYRYWFTRVTYKWVDRRSQRKSYNWEQFAQMLESIGWLKTKIKVNLCPFRT